MGHGDKGDVKYREKAPVGNGSILYKGASGLASSKKYLDIMKMRTMSVRRNSISR